MNNPVVSVDLGSVTLTCDDFLQVRSFPVLQAISTSLRALLTYGLALEGCSR